jgi:hypothetical protein
VAPSTKPFRLGSLTWPITARQWQALSDMVEDIYQRLKEGVAGVAGFTFTILTTGFSIGGGDPNSKTLTVTGDTTLAGGTVSGTNTGDQTITLTGDVTGTGTGSFVTAIGTGVIVNADINASAAIVDTKLDTIATAGKVSNSATTATAVNTNSAIIARDSSGNFEAGPLSVKTGKLGINTTAPDKTLELNEATGGTLRLTYNDSNGSAANKVDFSVDASGNLTTAPTTNHFTTFSVSGGQAYFDNTTGTAQINLRSNTSGTTRTGSVGIDTSGSYVFRQSAGSMFFDFVNAVNFRDGSFNMCARINTTSIAPFTANNAELRVAQVAALQSAMTGATVTATNLIPVGFLIGITVRVTTLITGATTFDIGDGVDVDRWGAAIAVAAGTVTTIASYTANGFGQFGAVNNVVLTANGANFTAGAVRITAHYINPVAATS